MMIQFIIADFVESSFVVTTPVYNPTESFAKNIHPPQQKCKPEIRIEVWICPVSIDCDGCPDESYEEVNDDVIADCHVLSIFLLVVK